MLLQKDEMQWESVWYSNQTWQPMIISRIGSCKAFALHWILIKVGFLFWIYLKVIKNFWKNFSQSKCSLTKEHFVVMRIQIFVAQLRSVSCWNLIFYLTRYMSLVPFYTPWKHQKTKGFLMFSGGYRKRSVVLNRVRTKLCFFLEAIITSYLNFFHIE